MQVRWLKRALRNLKEEAEFIAQDDPRAAAQIVTRIEHAVAMLRDHPHLGRVGRLPGTRELVVPDTPCLIPYRVRGQQIEILRVFHGGRRWPSAL
ncbi:MAG: type II toxin-antitoxin system RelE/ParE family toxin [Nevskia sp.]|nr:type II toxin-antitoxin system RelE/ParE family toxin [Nevskia sp.]